MQISGKNWLLVKNIAHFWTFQINNKLNLHHSINEHMFLVNTLGTKESQKTLNNIYSRLVVVILHTGDKKEKIQIEHNGRKQSVKNRYTFCWTCLFLTSKWSCMCFDINISYIFIFYYAVKIIISFSWLLHKLFSLEPLIESVWSIIIKVAYKKVTVINYMYDA